MDYVVILAVLVAAVWFLAGPLRAGHAEREDRQVSTAEADLEVARETKYREIREAELDYRTGKLSEADWRTQDRELRGEAVDILRALDRVRGEG